MKKTDINAGNSAVVEEQKTRTASNGNSNGHDGIAAAELTMVLTALHTMREGDFSVRLPGSWTGLSGKIADTFNDIVAANEHMAQELKRVGQVVGKEGRTRERTRFRWPQAGGWRWKSP